MEEMYQNLFEAFRNYIQACKSITSLLLDSRAEGESVDLKHSDFVEQFEKAKEFGELIDEIAKNEKIKKLGWEWQPETPLLEGFTPPYLHNFFENTGIYKLIRHGKGINIEKAFFHLFYEEVEKQIETTYRGQILGLVIDFGEQKQIDFREFSIENWDEKGPDFVISPYIVNKTLVQKPGSTVDCEEEILKEKFLDLEFIVNLYFLNPIFITLNQESNSLFSEFYNAHKIYDYSYDHAMPHEDLTALIESRLPKLFHIIEEDGRIITDGTGEEQEDDPEFVEETGINATDYFGLEAESLESDEAGDAWLDLREKAEKYFVKRGLFGNWLPGTDIPKFKEFIEKTWGFIQSKMYKKQEYIRIAVDFFKAGFKNLPRVKDTAKLSSPFNIINYVTALEALYCEDVAELREKLSNRVANLIGRTQSEKAEIRENLLEVYKIRSKYLHGSSVKIDQAFREKFEVKGDNKTSRRLEIWLRDIVRKSILRFFSLCKYYPSNEERTKLLNRLSNPYKEIHDIQSKASEFLPATQS